MIEIPEILDDTSHASWLEPSPLVELRVWLDQVEALTGMRPTKLRIPPDAWQEIRRDKFLAMYHDENPAGHSTIEAVSAIVGIDEIELVYPPPCDSGGEVPH